MLQGIDVSSWSHPGGAAIDWNQVAPLIDFGIVKATEGTDYINPFFADDFAQLAARGKLRGAYHYARPDQSQAEDEAAHFIGTVGSRLQPFDFVALDLETGDGNLADWAERWLGAVAEILHCNPLLYSGDWFAIPHGLSDQRLAPYGPWWAAYGTVGPSPPAPWNGFYAIWQYGVGTVPGIAAPCDFNRFNGTLDQLRLYGKPAPVPPPVATMTNDDAIQAIRLLLPPGALDPAAADAYLQPFVGGSHAASQSLASPAAAVHRRPTPSAASQPRGEHGRFATVPRAGSGPAAGCKQ